MSVKHILSLSGGKDSTAMLIHALNKGITFIAVFADTGHEHEMTYDYIQYLEEVTGIRIRRVKADFSEVFARRRKWIREHWPNHGIEASRIDKALSILQPTGVPFLDLCLVKGRFPSTKARFCSQMLKHEPIFYQVVDPLLENHDVVSWQGIRRDESLSRAQALRIEDVGGGLWNYRPILDWKIDDVFRIHQRAGIKPNPLYQLGMGRVGCMPCIHARKQEILEIARRFPEVVDKLEAWEDLVATCSKRGLASFFPADKTPGISDQIDATNVTSVRIRAVVEWSRTSRGGKQYQMLYDDGESCSSLYGLCE